MISKLVKDNHSMKCPVHDQMIDLYCRKCVKPICHLCVPTSCKLHKCTSFDDVTQEHFVGVERRSAKIGKLSQLIKKSSETVSKARQGLMAALIQLSCDIPIPVDCYVSEFWLLMCRDR